ncbi:MAG TPA: hypothetical protein DDW50_02325, partial [Firmicutes bacterium]|nr:hypothetical protein [Bacillota bacterium]
DRQGTRIAFSNRQDKLNAYFEQISLLSNRLGYVIGLDTEQKLSLGLCFTPDQKNAVEIRWSPLAAQEKWQVRWKYKNKI